MPAKKDNNTLTYQELTAFDLHEIKGKTIPETAAIVGVDESTIDNWKKRQPWHELAIAAIQEKDEGLAVEKYAEKLLEMRDRTKKVNVGGALEEIDDNVAQIRYLDSIEKVFGLYAPQKHEITAGISDAEIDKELEEAASKLSVESMEVQKQRAGSGSSDEGEGTVLPV